jgi:hypothetical protein
MPQGSFQPLRVLAELNALGVRYVLVGDLAEAAPEIPASADSVEICVADDDDNIDRLRILMVALDAQQDGATNDPHRAAFRTVAGRLECIEMPAQDDFVRLDAQATHLDFGHGVIARGVAGAEAPIDEPRIAQVPVAQKEWERPVAQRAAVDVEPVDPRELIESVRRAARVKAQPVEEEPAVRRFGRRNAEEDEYGPDPAPDPQTLKPWQKVWKAFEDIDVFLTDLNERPLLRPKSRRAEPEE